MNPPSLLLEYRQKALLRQGFLLLEAAPHGFAGSCLPIGGRAGRVPDRLSRALRHGLWVIPLGCLLAGIALSFLTLAIDRAHDYELISQDVAGDATSSEIFLSTTAATILTLASLVLSLTLVP